MRGRDVVAALVALILLVQAAEELQGAAAQGECSKASPCPAASHCCSQWGYCGTGPDYCGKGCLAGPCTASAGSCSKASPCPVASHCCSKYGFCGTGVDYCGTGCLAGPCTTTGGGSSSGWSGFLTKSVFEGFFPNRNAGFYTYANFQKAAAKYPSFGNAGSLDDRKRELAALLGNVNQESGGLQFINELDTTQVYCDSDPMFAAYPCAPGKKYYGRGPIQLSWNYNYGACGKALGKPLRTDPDLVARDGAVAFQTALWFWMTEKCHDAILASKPSFANTIRIINGRECGKPPGSLENTQMQNRVTYYKQFCAKLGVSPGTDLTC